MDAQAKIRQTYLVEHYWPGFTVEALQQRATRIRVAADEVGREGKPVRYVRSTIVPADESILCLLEAATEELVHETYARAGIAFDRISPAIPEADEGREQPPGAGGCATESN